MADKTSPGTKAAKLVRADELGAELDGTPPIVSKEHEVNFRAAFDKMDYAHRGKIGKKELARTYSMLGLEAGDDDFEDMLEAAGGEVAFPAFLNIMARSLESRTTEDVLRATFSVFDADGSGQVNLAEFRSVLTRLGENLSDAEYADVMRGVDLDRSGAIDFDEFKRILG